MGRHHIVRTEFDLWEFGRFRPLKDVIIQSIKCNSSNDVFCYVEVNCCIQEYGNLPAVLIQFQFYGANIYKLVNHHKSILEANIEVRDDNAYVEFMDSDNNVICFVSASQVVLNPVDKVTWTECVRSEDICELELAHNDRPYKEKSVKLTFDDSEWQAVFEGDAWGWHDMIIEKHSYEKLSSSANARITLQYYFYDDLTIKPARNIRGELVFENVMSCRVSSELSDVFWEEVTTGEKQCCVVFWNNEDGVEHRVTAEHVYISARVSDD